MTRHWGCDQPLESLNNVCYHRLTLFVQIFCNFSLGFISENYIHATNIPKVDIFKETE